MYIGMNVNDFKEEWLRRFADGLSESEINNHYVREHIWHIFSWELLPSDAYLKNEQAAAAFDRADKAGAWCILPFAQGATVEALPNDRITAEQVAEEIEIYVVAKDGSWTYIKTHESDCGPYFYGI